MPGRSRAIHLIELDDQVEVALWRPVGKIDTRERADVADLPDQFLVWHGVGADDHALALLHAAAFRLFEPGRHAQRRQIRHFGDDLPRPRAVARLEIGRRTARAPVRHDGHNTIHGRHDFEAAKLTFGVLHVEARLVPLLDLAAQLCLLYVAQRFQLPLGLASLAFASSSASSFCSRSIRGRNSLGTVSSSARRTS